MRLVVCVDRDDDLGRKAGVAGPVIGRTAVIEAATKLAIADPEESDANAMFGAVRVYDELVRTGARAEICVLTGQPKVGLLSDTQVGEQFDEVLRQVPAKSAHIVSDGAEDDAIYPIIASRLRINGMHRVIVRQSAGLESTYYTLTRALKDPKLRAKTVLPLALVLLILGLAAASGILLWGVIGLAVLFGVYLIFWTFDIDEALIESLRSASSDVRHGSVAFGFGLFSIGLVGVGFLTGYDAYLAALGNGTLNAFLTFLQAGFVWWIAGAVVWESGRALRRYITVEQFPRSFFVATASLVGIGLMTYGVIYLLEYLQHLIGGPELPVVIVFVVLGLTLVILAGVLQQYFRAGAQRSVGEPTTG